MERIGNVLRTVLPPILRGTTCPHCGVPGTIELFDEPANGLGKIGMPFLTMPVQKAQSRGRDLRQRSAAVAVQSCEACIQSPGHGRSLDPFAWNAPIFCEVFACGQTRRRSQPA